MDAYTSFKKLKFDRPASGIIRITLSRPDRLNAADAQMHREMAEVWRAVDADPEILAAIVTGEGRAFSAGGDLEIAEQMTRDYDMRKQTWLEAKDIVYNMINCSKPIISAIRGPAVGAGLAVALLADISIASKTARLIDGHTRLGVTAGDHCAIIWPLLCGMAKSKYHLLLCEPVSGEEAERIGLVSLCVADEDLDDKAVEVALRLADGASDAVSWTKYALNNWLRMMGPTFDTSLALEILSFSGEQVIEGIDSLREKRTPRFRKS